MSALFGIWRIDGRPVTDQELGRMGRALVHRDREQTDAWTDGAVGLGHGTRSSMDPSSHCVGVADARLDNCDDLVATLGCDPNLSNAQLIVAAYERWGERCPERLLGDWAFAIWDLRNRTMFCARDHMGVKPFYYHHAAGHLLVFASEIKALWQVPEVPRRINEVQIGDYLLPTFEDTQSTFYEDVVRLPPAHALVVTERDVRVAPYWELDPDTESQLGSDEAFSEAFRALLHDAVRCRMRSAPAVGSLLSGGLDSSSITCIAETQAAAPLATYSAVFDDVPQSDERSYMHAVLAAGRYDPHYVHGDQIGPLHDWQRALEAQDEPFNSPNLFIHSALYRAARAHGTKTLLDGFDGDTTVSHGMGYLTELANGLRWVRLFRESRGLSRRFELPLPRVLWRQGVQRFRPTRAVWNSVRGRAPHRLPPNTVLNREFERRLGLAERHELLQAEWLEPPRTEHADHLRRLQWGILPYVCEVLDRAAAAEGVEPRYPFFDKRLVEFCLSLPPGQKIGDGWTRLILRRAMDGVLPDEVRWRGGKGDPGPNFVLGLLRHHRELLDELILGEPGHVGDYVDVTVLRAAYQQLVAQGRGDQAALVWRAAVLSLWLRTR